MDPNAALKRLVARSRPLSGGEEQPRHEAFTDLEEYRHVWFRHWLKRHGVSISGFAAVSGIGRTSVSSLVGSGRGMLWTRLDRPTVEAIVRTMNLVSPTSAETLRQDLQLPDGLEAWTGVHVPGPGPGQASLDRARSVVVEEYSRNFSDAGVAQRRLLQGRDLDDELVPSRTYRVLPELITVKARTDNNTRSQVLRQVLGRYLEDRSLPIAPSAIPSQPRQALSWVLRPEEVAIWRALDAATRTGLVNAALQDVNRSLNEGRYERILLDVGSGVSLQAMTAGPGHAVTRAYLRQPDGEGSLLARPLWQGVDGQPVLATSEDTVGITLLWELYSTAERPPRSQTVFRAPSFYDAVYISRTEALEQAAVNTNVLDFERAREMRRLRRMRGS